MKSVVPPPELLIVFVVIKETIYVRKVMYLSPVCPCLQTSQIKGQCSVAKY